MAVQMFQQISVAAANHVVIEEVHHTITPLLPNALAQLSSPFFTPTTISLIAIFTPSTSKTFQSDRKHASHADSCGKPQVSSS